MDVNVGSNVISLFEAVSQTGTEFASKLGGFGGFGFNLALILLAIVIAWTIIENIIGSDRNMIASIIRSCIIFMIVASLLSNWTSGGSSGKSLLGGSSVQEFFIEGIPSIGEKITGYSREQATQKTIESFMAAISNIVDTTIDKRAKDKRDETLNNSEADLKKLYDNSVLTPSGAFNIMTPEQRAAIEQARQKVSDVKNDIKISEDASDTSIFNVTGAINSFVAYVIRLIAAFFIFWAMLSFIFMINIGEILCYVGLAVGPALVPFILLKPGASLFNNWLKFMISSSFYTVIALVLAGMLVGTSGSDGIITYIMKYTTQAATSDESIVFLSMVMMFFAILAKVLMDKTDDIAKSLAGGGVSVGGGGAGIALGAAVGAAKTTVSAGKNVGSIGKAIGKTDAGKAVKQSVSNKASSIMGALGSAVGLGSVASSAVGAATGIPPGTISTVAGGMSGIRTKMAGAKQRNGR